MESTWNAEGSPFPERGICGWDSGGTVSQNDAARIEAAMSAIDRNRTSGSSCDAMKPRRRQNTAASSSTAFTSSALPPISDVAVTQRVNTCLTSPVPMPRPTHCRSVASCPSSREGTGSGGWPVRMARGRGAQLTTLGEKLLWAEQRSDASLFPQLDNVASELNLEIGKARSRWARDRSSRSRAGLHERR